MKKALFIPWDESLPVEEFEYNEERWTEMAERITGTPTGILGTTTFPTQHTQLFYDDMGSYDQPNNTNTRAMKLAAHLRGVSLDDYRQHLVGNYMVLGLDPYMGDTEDVTKEVRYFFGEEGIEQ